MAIDKKLAGKLAKAKKMWGKAKDRAATEKGGISEIEDGRYIARLTNAEIGESKSSSRLQVSWTYTIMEGESKGSKKMDFDGLETEDNLMYLARKLAKYGYEPPDDIEEVENVLNAIVKEKPLVKVRLKTKGGSDFQNVYLDNVYEKDDEDDVLAEAAAEAVDDTEEATDDAEEVTDDDATVEEEEAAEEEAVEEEPADDGEVELAVGMKVGVTMNKETYEGKVIEILEAENKVRVKLANGKTVRVATDALVAAAEEEEVEEDLEEDVPEKPVAKKVAPAPAKKAKK